MSRVSIDETVLTNTADAIRAKTGESAKLGPMSFASAIQSIEGGANPNVVETYTGTVENVFTSNGIGLRGLVEQVEANAATVKLTIDATSVNMGVLSTVNIWNTIEQDTSEITEAWLMVFALTNLENTMAGELRYGSVTDHNAGLYAVRMLTPATEGQIVDARAMVKDLPCTLTIIRHPLPESTTGGNA